MKKIIITLIAAAFITVLSAHPADKVSAKFNFDNSNLSVEFEHPVKDNTQHFISIVSVELNGKEIIMQKMISQEDMNKGSLIYKVSDAKAGDKITVKTRCNKTGNKSFDLVLKKEEPVKQAVEKKAVKK